MLPPPDIDKRKINTYRPILNLKEKPAHTTNSGCIMAITIRLDNYLIIETYDVGIQVRARVALNLHMQVLYY